MDRNDIEMKYFSPRYSPIARLLKPVSFSKNAAICSGVF